MEDERKKGWEAVFAGKTVIDTDYVACERKKKLALLESTLILIRLLVFSVPPCFSHFPSSHRARSRFVDVLVSFRLGTIKKIKFVLLSTSRALFLHRGSC